MAFLVKSATSAIHTSLLRLSASNHVAVRVAESRLLSPGILGRYCMNADQQPKPTLVVVRNFQTSAVGLTELDEELSIRRLEMENKFLRKKLTDKLLKLAVLEEKQNTQNYLSRLLWIRVTIDRFEKNFGIINAKLNWLLIDEFSNNTDRLKEIRRQWWVHILTEEKQYPRIQRLLKGLQRKQISVEEFATDMAEGYDLICDRIELVIAFPHGVPFLTIKDESFNRSIELLIENIEFNVGQTE